MKDRAQRTPDPTPEEIAERAAAIRKANDAAYRKQLCDGAGRPPRDMRRVDERVFDEGREIADC